jgi:multidrug efflux pump subunit AcrA (membrane-fusion protein)
MRKPRSRPWYLYALGVLAVTLVALAVTEIGPPASSARTSTQIVSAAKGVVQSTVSGTGNVEAGADLDVNFQTSGTLSHVYVTAGQHVNKGQLLATLDSGSAQLALDQAEQTLTAAQDQLASAEGNSSTTNASLQPSGAGTTEFVSDVTTTPSSTSSTAPTTTSSTGPSTPPTTSTTTTSASTTTPSTTTPSNPTPTVPSPAPAQTTSPGSSASTGTSGGGGPASAGGGGSAASGSGSGGSTSSVGSIPTAQAAVDSAEQSVQSAKTALADTKLYAPTSGTIIATAGLSDGDSVSVGSTSSVSGASSSSSSTSSTAGATTAGGLGSSGSTTGTSSSSETPFVEIVNSKTMTMTVALSESDVSKVKVGQPATVTLDALSGVTLGAHVTAISPVGTTSNSVVSYDATLTLDQSDSQVKVGMSASASVIVGQAQGVTVPNNAVTGTGSLATVTVLDNGRKTTKQVAVGLRGDTRTQIISGLSAGDQLVVTTTLPPLTSSTPAGSTSGAGTLGGAGAAGVAGGRPGGFGGAGGGFGAAGRARPAPAVAASAG